MTLKYFNVKNGLSTGNIFLHSGNSNVVANTFIGNLSVTGLANLGNVENIRITGGNSGQVLSTDGSGYLTWVTQTGGGNVQLQLPDVSVDTFTADGSNNSFTLTTTPTNTDYVFVNVDGVFQFRDSFSLTGNVLSFGSTPLQNSLIEVSVMVPGSGGSGGSANTIYNGNSNVKVYANSDVTISSNGTANVVKVSSSDITISANIIPSANVTYDLGNATNRFKDLYLSNNSIHLGDTIFTANSVLPFNLTISPEVLTINADAPFAGNDIKWLFSWQQSTLPYARTTIVNQEQASVPLYKQGTYQVNNFANEMHGSMDQRHLLFQNSDLLLDKPHSRL